MLKQRNQIPIGCPTQAILLLPSPLILRACMSNLHQVCPNLLASTVTTKAIGASSRALPLVASVVLPLGRRNGVLLPCDKVLIDGLVFQLVEFVVLVGVGVGWLLLLLLAVAALTACSALLIRCPDCEGLHNWVANNVGLVEEAGKVVLTQVAVVWLVRLVRIVVKTVKGN